MLGDFLMKSKVLYLESSYPINTRSQRIIDSLKDSNVHVCTWDRTGNSGKNKDLNYSIYKTPNVGYGNKFLKISALFGYARFYLKVLKEEKPNVVVCSHWDMLLIATMFKNNEKIVYDNVDIPEFKIRAIENIIIWLEKLALKRVEVSLLASRFYGELYKSSRYIVLENLPVSEINSPANKNIDKDIVKIGFVGSVRHYDLLVNLIESIQGKNNVELHIYGDGIAKEKLEKYCKMHSILEVFFHGYFDYREIRYIYEKLDVLWAAYPHQSRNVQYAISNKFFESIYYSIPCLFSNNTKLGDYVTENQLGITVNPYVISSIEEGIDKLLFNYESIHTNLKLFNEGDNICWSKNEEKLKNVMAELSKK